MEQQLMDDPKEQEVIARSFKALGADWPRSSRTRVRRWPPTRPPPQEEVADLKAANAPDADMQAAEKALVWTAQGRGRRQGRSWTAAKAVADTKAKPLNGHAPPRPAVFRRPEWRREGEKTFDNSRRNFLALVFCLMVGTAALPHILMRYYTTPSVKEARESVTWSLFFIFLLYFTAPALAVLVKYEVFHVLVGTPFDQLPAWIGNWSKVDPTCCRCRHQQATASCSSTNVDRRRHHRAGDAGNRRPALRDLGHGGRRAAWPRRCPPPTACC
jgi:cation/acetate symporter